MAVGVPFETEDVGSRGGLYRLDAARPQSSAGLSTKDKQVIHYWIPVTMALREDIKNKVKFYDTALNHNETII